MLGLAYVAKTVIATNDAESRSDNNKKDIKEIVEVKNSKEIVETNANLNTADNNMGIKKMIEADFKQDKQRSVEFETDIKKKPIFEDETGKDAKGTTSYNPGNSVVLTEKDAKEKSTAVFYGANLPTDILSQYKRIIVEPDNVKPDELLALRANNSGVFAYVSIGEVNPSRKWFKKIKADWVLGDNKVWDSKVMDLASSGWQDFLVDTVVAPLWKAGYRGLFLDTMDSFYIFAKNKQQQEIQTKALTQLMQKIHKRYPEMRFISNRGFEVLPSIGKQLEAVVAESLYASWDNGKKIYQDTPENDQKWLLNKLNKIKKELSIDVIIIDYAEPANRTHAKDIADKIAQQGFIPWVSIPSLDLAGVGSIKPTLDNYLLLTDSKTDGHTPLKLKKYQQLIEMLKKKDKNLKVHDIQLGLPLGHMSGRYIGLINTLPAQKQSKAYKAWLVKQKQEGMPIKRHP
jgi:uncharacterized protein (TIGR01370 family)